MQSSYDSEVAAIHTSPAIEAKNRKSATRISSEKFSSDKLKQLDLDKNDLKLNSKINQLTAIKERRSTRFPRRDEFSTKLSLAEAEVLELINEYRRPAPTVSVSAKDVGKFTPIREKSDTPSNEETQQKNGMN